METSRCIFCSQESKTLQDDKDNIICSCPNCGNYIYTCEVGEDFPRPPENWQIASGFIRELNDMGLHPELITTENYQALFYNHLAPKTTMEQVNKILLHYYRNNYYFGVKHHYNTNDKLTAIGYTKFPNEIFNMLLAARDMDFIKSLSVTGQIDIDFAFTLKGLAHVESLLQKISDSKKVFIATKFSPVEGYAFPYQLVREEAIKPAVKESCGLSAFTIDEEEHNNYITDKIISEIKTSRFLVADLTYNNCGVYWEAGFARGLGKEVIHICNEDWHSENGLHFDLAPINCILWTGLEELKEKLINRIRATIV